MNGSPCSADVKTPIKQSPAASESPLKQQKNPTSSKNTFLRKAKTVLQQKENEPDKITRKLSEIESSVCGLLLDLKCAMNNSSKTDTIGKELDTLKDTIDGMHSAVAELNKSVKLIDKQIKQLTEATNKKFSDIGKKVDQLASISETTSKRKLTECGTQCNENDLVELVADRDHKEQTTPKCIQHSGILRDMASDESQTPSTSGENLQNLSINLPSSSDNADSSDSDQDSEHSDHDSDSESDTATVCEVKVQTNTQRHSKRSNNIKPDRQQKNEMTHSSRTHGSRQSTTHTKQPKTHAKEYPQTDLLIIGNSNTRQIDGRKVYTKKSCRVVTLRNKTIQGAESYIHGMNDDATKPKCVAFLVGSNEIGQKSETQIVDECKQLIHTCRSTMPSTSVVLMGIPTRGGLHREVTTVNAALEQMCNKEQIQYVQNNNISYHHHLISDKLHLNGSGIRVLVSNLKQVVNNILGVGNSTSTPPMQQDSRNRRSTPRPGTQQHHPRRFNGTPSQRGNPASTYPKESANTHHAHTTVPSVHSPPPSQVDQQTKTQTVQHVPWPYMNNGWPLTHFTNPSGMPGPPAHFTNPSGMPGPFSHPFPPYGYGHMYPNMYKGY